MLDLRFTNSFRKDYKLMKKRGYDLSLFNEIVAKLQRQEPLDSRHHDHELIGKRYKGLRECHIQPNWLLAYRIIDGELILELCYTGTHSDLS